MELVANFALNNDNLNAQFDVSEVQNFDAVFKINAAGTTWGSIDGTLSNQTDLQSALNLKANKTEVQADLEAINDTITENYDTLDNKIDSLDSELSGEISVLSQTVSDNNTALNNRINTTNSTVSNLNNTVSSNYITLDNKINSVNTILGGDINALEDTVSSNYTTLDNKINSLDSQLSGNIGELETAVSNLDGTVQSNYTILDTKIDAVESTLQDNIDTLSGTVQSNYTDLTNSIDSNVVTLNTRINGEVSALISSISSESTARQNSDNDLQSQIDAIVSSSDVFDIVGTYAELQAYDISTVPVNDIIKVLVDSTHSNAATYYRCVENADVKSWSYIGSEGAYYTKAESDSNFVPQTRTINGQALSTNITLNASDVGALPSTTQIGNGTITLTQGGVQKGTFTLNQSGNTTIDFNEGTTITVDSVLSTSSENPVQNKVITTELNTKQGTINDLAAIRSGASLGSTSLQPNDNISELNNNAGYITGISSSDVISALGYTPYDSSNPSGYTSNIGTVTSVNNVTPVNGNVSLSIPTVGNGTITIQQDGQNVGTFTTNQSGNSTISLTGGSSRNIGEIVASTIPLTDAGLHLFDGTLLQYGSYQAFIDYIAGLVTDYPDLFTTEANWQAEVLATGFCDKYVYDSTNNTVRLPKIGNQLIHNIPSTLGVKGNGMTLGLTNGTANGALVSGSDNNYFAVKSAYYGFSPRTGATPDNGIYGSSFGVTTDSTKSGIVAETNNINTADVYYYVVIATVTKTAIQVDIDEIATDLNGKADVDLTNVNNQGTALSTHWMTTDASYEIRITPPASSSSGNTLANTTLFTAPCNGWVTVEATTNNSSGRFWIFGASSGAHSSVFHGNGGSQTSRIFVKKGEQVLLRGAYVSVINAILFYPCEGVKWEVQ